MMLNKEESIFKNDDIFFIRILTLGCSSLVTILYCLFVELFIKTFWTLKAFAGFLFLKRVNLLPRAVKSCNIWDRLFFLHCAFFSLIIFLKKHT